MIGRRSVAGFDALTLANTHGDLEATFVPAAGMVGCSLRDNGAELLGQRRGLHGYVEGGSTMGIPLLYPWANRLSRDRLELAGREVDLNGSRLRLKRDANGMAMHGLLTAYPGWEVIEHGSTIAGGILRAELDFGADEALAAAFPFPHRVRLSAVLSDRTLSVALTVEPTADARVPIAFGFHPYLSLPGAPRSEWELEAPVRQSLRLDERGIPTGERMATAIERGPLGDRSYDDAFVAPSGGAPFALSAARRRVEIAFGEGYPYAQIYAPADDALIAIEPMTAPTDALVSGDCLRFATPGESFTARFSITVAEVE
jgi:galactose mutarotase-like enzyme